MRVLCGLSTLLVAPCHPSVARCVGQEAIREGVDLPGSSHLCPAYISPHCEPRRPLHILERGESRRRGRENTGARMCACTSNGARTIFSTTVGGRSNWATRSLASFCLSHQRQHCVRYLYSMRDDLKMLSGKKGGISKCAQDSRPWRDTCACALYQFAARPYTQGQDSELGDICVRGSSGMGALQGSLYGAVDQRAGRYAISVSWPLRGRRTRCLGTAVVPV